MWLTCIRFPSLKEYFIPRKVKLDYNSQVDTKMLILELVVELGA